MRLLGCLGLLLVLAVIAGESYSFVVAHRLLGTYAHDLIGGTQLSDTILPILLLQVAMMVIGVLAVKNAISRLPNAFLGSLMGQGSGAGRLLMQAIGGIFLIIPGFFLDLIGILLLLPPVQALLGGLGQRFAMSLLKRQMGKMFPGGMPGGFDKGGFSAAAFPGMQQRGPLRPDERMAKPGKIIDTTAERVDGKG